MNRYPIPALILTVVTLLYGGLVVWSLASLEVVAGLIGYVATGWFLGEAREAAAGQDDTRDKISRAWIVLSITIGLLLTAALRTVKP